VAEPRDPVSIKDVLAEGEFRGGLDGALEVGRLWAAWEEIVGPAVARHAEPTSLRNGILRVRADSPVWATEVAYLAAEIQRRSNEAARAPVVGEVRVWHRPGPVAERGSPRERPEAGSRSRNEDGKRLRSTPMEAFQRARAAWEKVRSHRHRRSL
jgi:predicted nucleic acid-binding Zn ribbon protein